MILTVACIGIVFMVNNLYDTLIKEERMRIQQVQMQYQAEQSKMNLLHLQEMQRFMHDYIKHLIVIKQAIKDNNNTYALQYIENIHETIHKEPVSMVNSGSRVIDALTYHLINQCEQHQIALEYQFNINQILVTDDMALSIIMATYSIMP